MNNHWLTVNVFFNTTKAGESRGRAPGQAGDYALRAPNPLDNSAMTRCFIKISGPPNQSGPQVFCLPPLPPLSPALNTTNSDAIVLFIFVME